MRAKRYVFSAVAMATLAGPVRGLAPISDPPTPQLRAMSLVAATGGEYLAQRDSALLLSQPEFEVLVAQLKREGAAPKELVVAWALEVRRARPDAAASFDAASAEALANPIHIRSGRPAYRITRPTDPADDPLLFEWLLKRGDLSKEARWRTALNVGKELRTSPLTPTAALALIDEPEAPVVDLLQAIVMQSGDTIDQRALDVIVQKYREARSTSINPSMMARTIASILGGSTDRKVFGVLQALIEEERALAIAAGIEPWNDLVTNDELVNASLIRNEVKQRQLKGEPPGDLSLEAAEANVIAVKRRLDLRNHWEALKRSAERVAAVTDPR